MLLLSLSQAHAQSSSATFLQTDTATQGNWHGAYGADGYSVSGDSQSAPSYATFAIQNQQGYTWAASTTDVRALQTADGSTRIAAAWYNASTFSFSVNLIDGNTHQVALYALDWDNSGRAETIQILDAATQTVLDTRSISAFTNGEYLVWNISGNVQINVTQTAGVNAVVSGLFFGGSSAISSTVSFVSMDTTTQGNWHGAYGADGYSVVGDTQSIPAYAAFAAQNQATWTWETSTADVRALQTGSGSGRVAAAWYNSPEFNLDVNFTDGNTHQFAVYAVDWDNSGRAEVIQVLDAATEAVLDTRTISGFTNGEYLVWNFSGHVRINVIQTGSVNAVVSGVFFGGSSTINATASFVRTDLTTEGNWHGAYGADGYSVEGDSQSLPSYAAFAVQNQQNYTWVAGTTDIRALQTGNGATRIAATWYNSPEFNFDVNFTDGNSHQFALYALDWDNSGRTETIQILDAATEAILDTRSISGFTNGQYLVWNISGHVHINVIQTGGLNAVVSGVFFGGSSTISSTASFVRMDTTTQGNWHGTYGADGYSVVGDTQSIPAYAAFAAQNQATWVWDASSTDVRALQTGSGSGRIAATWYNNPEFNLDVNFTDGNSHQFALYAVDWDSLGRAQVVQVLDAATEAVLDTRTISGFTNGEYLVWNFSGHVRINVIQTGDVNAVVSGVFFGGSSTINATASFVGTDLTTQGSWEGVYGNDGYSISGDSQSVPAYATFNVQNQQDYTWAASTSDVRALQSASGSGRLAATWYNSPEFNFDVNFTDGNTHEFSLYAVDWDALGRAETIQILDAATEAMLDTRSISAFTNGEYLVWNISGHVHINVIQTGSTNAVVSGAFFGGGTGTGSGNAPVIASLSPTSGPVGTLVTITGTNFGTTPGTISFNSTLASVTSWGPSTIIATVPSNATSGNVVVTVGGVASMGSNFTVSTLTSLLLAPATASISVGSSFQFTLTGIYSDGSNLNISSAASWSSSALNIATISGTGLATGVAVGQTTIQATIGGLAASENLGVSSQTQTGSLPSGVSGNTLTALEDSTVLVAGGYGSNGQSVNSAAIYNSSTGTFAAAGNLNTARANHTATLLNNGMVLIVGGIDNNGNTLQSAELYNPATGAFTTTGSLNTARSSHTATMLPSGTVVIVGGADSSGNSLNSAELYDPTNATFTLTGSLNTARQGNTATLLGNGMILFAGGMDANGNILQSAELYNPATAVFSMTGNMTTPREVFTATLLNNGLVLMTGGIGSGQNSQASAELYNPIAGTFAATANLNSPRSFFTATLLNNGTVLVTGGLDASGNVLGSAELYDPVAATFTLTSNIIIPRYSDASVLLNNGNVLEVGGLDSNSNQLASAEEYQPDTLTPPGLISIAVSPVSPLVTAGLAQSFVATGTFADNSTQTLASVTWSSSNQAEATISDDVTNSGTANPIAAGSVTISSCTGSICGSTVLTIALPVSLTPSVASVSPTSASIGTLVTITGTNFGAAQSQGSSTVTFNGIDAVPTSWSNTQIVVPVPSGAATGPLNITVNGVVLTASSQFGIVPNISAITPSSALVGTAVTITGSGFGASMGNGNVILGTSTGTVVSWTDTQIIALVAPGSASGFAEVLQSGFSSNATSFSVSTPPSLTSISPSSGTAGTQVTFIGSGFGATQGNGTVLLGNAYGLVISWSDAQVVALVASGSTSGTAQVIQHGFGSNSVSFTVTTPTPAIVAVTPTSGTAGTQVTVAGSGFGSTQGNGRVVLGTTNAAVTSWSDSQIIATIPTGSLSGSAQVQQSGMWSNSVTFTVITPSITSVSPASGEAGTQVTINGSGFGTSQSNGNTWLGTTYGAVVSWSDTQIVATVATGSASGYAQVLQNGVWSNSVPFTTGIPQITSVTPPYGSPGTQITVAGSGFGSSPGVLQLGTMDGLVSTWTDTQIVATVASGSVTGLVQVQQNSVTSNSLRFVVPTQGSGNSVILTPSKLNLLVGQTHSIQALNPAGTEVTGLAWSTSDPTLVSLSTDDPPILTALAPGRVTITAGDSSSDVTVSSGSTLPVNTVVWSAPGDGSGVNYIIPAVPSPTGKADLFAVQNSGNVQAITSDGAVAWQANNVGTNSLLNADFQGGFVASNASSITKYDGLTGLQDSQYTYNNPSNQNAAAFGTDGTIFTVDGAYIVGVNPETGTAKFRVPMTLSTDSATYTCEFQRTTNGSSPPSVGASILAGDGYFYTVYQYTKSEYNDAPQCAGNATQNTTTLALVRVGSTGDSATMTLGSWTSSAQTIEANSATPGHYTITATQSYTQSKYPMVLQGMAMSTNADQGIFLTGASPGTDSYCSSVTNYEPYSPATPTVSVGCVPATPGQSLALTVGASGGSLGTQTAVATPNGSTYAPLLQGLDGTFYGYTSESTLSAFDELGNVKWNAPLGYFAAMLTADGSVIGQSSSGQAVSFDQNGNATNQIANFPTLSWKNTYQVTADQTVGESVAPIITPMASFAALGGGNFTGNGTPFVPEIIGIWWCTSLISGSCANQTIGFGLNAPFIQDLGFTYAPAATMPTTQLYDFTATYPTWVNQIVGLAMGAFSRAFTNMPVDMQPTSFANPCPNQGWLNCLFWPKPAPKPAYRHFVYVTGNYCSSSGITDPTIETSYVCYQNIMTDAQEVLPGYDVLNPYSPQYSSNLTPSQQSAFTPIINAIGIAIGNVSAHELGHQFALPQMDCDKPALDGQPAGPPCPGQGDHTLFYEYWSDTPARFQYAGPPMTWTDADQADLLKALMTNK